MADHPPPRKGGFNPLAGMDPRSLRALALGLELAAVIGGLGWGGHWLDQRYGTDPKWLVAGLVLGMTLGCWNVYRASQGENSPFSRTVSRQKKPDRKPPSGPSPS